MVCYHLNEYCIRLYRYVFWGSLSHSNNKIERADMDGKNRITVANIQNASPDGLFVLEESEGHRICWVEHENKRVRCASSNGDMSVLIANLDGSTHPSDITALAGSWYITDIGAGVIWKCNKVSCEKFMTGLKLPKGIASNANVTTGKRGCGSER